MTDSTVRNLNAIAINVLAGTMYILVGLGIVIACPTEYRSPVADVQAAIKDAPKVTKPEALTVAPESIERTAPASQTVYSREPLPQPVLSLTDAVLTLFCPLTASIQSAATSEPCRDTIPATCQTMFATAGNRQTSRSNRTVKRSRTLTYTQFLQVVEANKWTPAVLRCDVPPSDELLTFMDDCGGLDRYEKLVRRLAAAK